MKALKPHLAVHWETIEQELRNGTYRPAPVMCRLQELLVLFQRTNSLVKGMLLFMFFTSRLTIMKFCSP